MSLTLTALFLFLGAVPFIYYGIALFSCWRFFRRPLRRLLAGLVSFLGYQGIMLYVRYGLNITHPTTGLPLAGYVSFSILILISGVTFLVTSLAFPVATTWGTFLHAAGPVHVLFVIASLVGLDRLIATQDLPTSSAGRIVSRS